MCIGFWILKNGKCMGNSDKEDVDFIYTEVYLGKSRYSKVSLVRRISILNGNGLFHIGHYSDRFHTSPKNT